MMIKLQHYLGSVVTVRLMCMAVIGTVMTTLAQAQTYQAEDGTIKGNDASVVTFDGAQCVHYTKPEQITWMIDIVTPGTYDVIIRYQKPGNPGVGWTMDNITSSSTQTGTFAANITAWTDTATFTIDFIAGTNELELDSGQNGQNVYVDYIVITPPVANIPPVITQGAGPLSQTIDEDETPTAFALTLNATDADDPASGLIWSIISGPSNGTANATSPGASSTIDYNPTPNFSGTDSFVVQVSDGTDIDTITVNVTITARPDDPVITEGATITRNISEDENPTAFSLTLNATDPDAGTTFTWSISTPAGNGTATASGTGASKVINYDPDPDWNGADTFVVEVSDGTGRTDTITVTVNVAAVNDPPVITQGATTTVNMSEDSSPTSFSLTLDATDVDHTGAQLTWAIDSPASNGTAGASGTGASKAITYTPTLNWNGTDLFVVKVTDGSGATDLITVTVNVAAVNDPPVINSVTATPSTVPIDTNTQLNAVATDVDSTLTYLWSVDSKPGGSTVTFTPTTPNIANPLASFSKLGTYVLLVEVDDGVNPPVTDTVTVTVATVSLPEILVEGLGNEIIDGDTSPTATDDTEFGTVTIGNTLDHTFTIRNTGTADLTVSGATAGGDFTIFASPAGTVTAGNSTTFTVRFSPSAASLRTATITITNNDADEATYTFSIQGTGQAPAGPEILVEGNSNEITDGDNSPTATDDTDFGSVTLGGNLDHIFTVRNTGTADLTVSTITAGGDFTVITNPAPTTVTAGNSITFTVRFSPTVANLRTATISISNNDANENPYTFSIRGTGQAAAAPEILVEGNGIEIVDGATSPSTTDHTDFGAVTVPPGGTVVRTFTIRNTGTASLSVSGVSEDHTYFSVTQTPSATVAASGSTTFQITYNPLVVGTHNATVTINNDDSDESPYTFAITGSAGANSPPVAADEGYRTGTWNTGDATPHFSLLAPGLLLNDSDTDGDTLQVDTGSVSTLQGDTGGTLSVSVDGSFTYTPSDGFAGTSTFTYQCTDGNGNSANATVTIRVVGPHGNNGCTDCHNSHGSGFGFLPRDGGQGDMCKSCHNATVVVDTATVSIYGTHIDHGGKANNNLECGACHDTHNYMDSDNPHSGGVLARNLKYIRSDPTKYVTGAADPLVYQSAAAPSHLAFTSPAPNPDNKYHGACQACHANTTFGKNAVDSATTHAGGTGLDADCLSCHTHQDNFQPPAGGSGCTGCHGSPKGTRRQIVGDAGDFQANASINSHHIWGGIPTDEQCDVCHDQSSHGAVVLRDADGGANLTDPTANQMTPFCLSCHDNNGASALVAPLDPLNPFGDGNAPPSIKLGWTATGAAQHRHSATLSCYRGDADSGCHSNGHGSKKIRLLGPPDVAATAPDFSEEKEGFCFTCHMSGGVGQGSAPEYKGDIKTGYDTIPNSYSGDHLNDRHDLSALMCSDCHDVHASKAQVDGSFHPLRANPDPETSGTDRVPGGAGYENYQTAGANFMSQWCLECHDHTYPRAGMGDPTVLTDIFDEYANNDKHGAQPSSDTKFTFSKSNWTRNTFVQCLDCHNAHMGGKRNGWRLRDRTQGPDTVGGTGRVDITTLDGTYRRGTAPGGFNYEVTSYSGGDQTSGYFWCYTCHDDTGSNGMGSACWSQHKHGSKKF